MSPAHMDRATEEAVCEALAQQYALRIALRALARTHPDPAGLLAAWRDVLTEAATCCPVTPSGFRRSDYIAERIRACAEDWTAELVELAVSGPDQASTDASPAPVRRPPPPDLRTPFTGAP